METLKKLFKKYLQLKQAGCNIPIIGIRFLYYYIFFGKKIIAHQMATIRNVRRIKMSGDSILYIGTSYRGFLVRHDRTLINVQGTLHIEGKVSIFQGARIDIGEEGVLTLKNGVSINSYTKIICAHKIEIGEDTGIGWDCQLLDSDFHEISMGKIKMPTKAPIKIGKSVLITNKVSIYKGVSIPDNVVIASDCIITRSIKNPGSLVYMDYPSLLIESKYPVTWKK